MRNKRNEPLLDPDSRPSAGDPDRPTWPTVAEMRETAPPPQYRPEKTVVRNGVRKMEPKRRWRTGRTVARTVYVQRLEEGPSKADELVGLMDTSGLAAYVCACVNYCQDRDIDPLAMTDPRAGGGF